MNEHIYLKQTFVRKSKVKKIYYLLFREILLLATYFDANRFYGGERKGKNVTKEQNLFYAVHRIRYKNIYDLKFCDLKFV